MSNQVLTRSEFDECLEVLASPSISAAEERATQAALRGHDLAMRAAAKAVAAHTKASPTLAAYWTLNFEMLAARAEGRQQDEDACLEEMDNVWPKLTDDERKLVDNVVEEMRKP